MKKEYTDFEVIEMLTKAYNVGFVDGFLESKGEKRNNPSDVDFAIKTHYKVTQQQLDEAGLKLLEQLKESPKS